MTNEGEDPTPDHRPGGRPLRLPDDLTPNGGTRVMCGPRIAWLLAINRLLGPDPALARRRGFIDVVARDGLRLDPSRLSRWESAEVAVPDTGVDAYEHALGAAEGSLVAVTAGLRRTLGAGRLPRRERGAGDVEDLDIDLQPLMSQTSLDDVTGGHWLRLTRTLERFDRVYLRAGEWSALCTKLVSELGIAAGLGFVRRYEAAVALLARDESRQHLGRAIAEYLTAPNVQAVGPVVSLLAEVDDPPISQLVVRMLGADNAALRLAAAPVAAMKLSRGQLREADIPQVEAYVAAGLNYGDSVSDSLESVDLAVQLPQDSWRRVARTVGSRRVLTLVRKARRTGEMAVGNEVRSVVADLADTIAAETPAHVPCERDMMLRRMLREAVLHADKMRRHHATLALAVTPYAGALARNLRPLAHHPSPVLAARANELLLRVLDYDERECDVPTALAEPREAIRARALVNIGMQGTDLGRTEDAALVRHAEESSRTLDRRAGLFALAMQGSPAVSELRENDDLAPAVRWWLERGPAVHDVDDVPMNAVEATG